MFRKQNEVIKQLTDKQIVQNLYFTQLILLIISSVLAILLFSNVEEFIELWILTDARIIGYGIAVALLVIVVDTIITTLVPSHLVDDGGINKKLFEKRTIPHIIILTVLIAISEELLFRGVLQTQLGIWVASLVFAILHFRYLSKWILFIMVILISFLLGIVYEITESLYTTIIAHFLIDLVFAIQIRLNYIKGVNKENE